jgi:hypothetical protein
LSKRDERDVADALLAKAIGDEAGHIQAVCALAAGSGPLPKPEVGFDSPPLT